MILRMNSLAAKREEIHANLPFHRQPEALLLMQAKRGRAQAFEELCQGNIPKLLKAAFRVTRNRQDAEDA